METRETTHGATWVREHQSVVDLATAHSATDLYRQPRHHRQAATPPGGEVAAANGRRGGRIVTHVQRLLSFTTHVCEVPQKINSSTK